MYLYKGKKVSVESVIEHNGAFYSVRNQGDREVLGITEVPDPVYPDPDLFFWTENEDGSLNITPKTEEQVAQVMLTRAKQERSATVARLSVTTQAGHTYDADKDSQIMMGAYLAAMDPGDIIPWVLADNTIVQIDKAELKEALRLAGAAMATVWVAPYAG